MFVYLQKIIIDDDGDKDGSKHNVINKMKDWMENMFFFQYIEYNKNRIINKILLLKFNICMFLV